eukprot:CAMPEP_0197247714 /NCGR_PEP_ID=MMETSP1429-20130617/31401_1 /TAXON_ID=49237 /ORGANISM="Chaetoceros  sp., Strain UNC1202" /LENGTH=104 /DNA_ID=CAMNT_0042708691 /DNA_START=117 /DNA_END=432 /DNA_ORIENTATION=-
MSTPINTMMQYQQQQVCNMGTKALIKTNKAAAKRIRVRGSGSVKRNRGGASHNTGYKTRGRSNRLGSSTGIKGTAIEKRMRRLLESDALIMEMWVKECKEGEKM